MVKLSLTMNVTDSLTKSKEAGLLLTPGTVDTLRAITHLDVNDSDIEKAADILGKVFS